MEAAEYSDPTKWWVSDLLNLICWAQGTPVQVFAVTNQVVALYDGTQRAQRLSSSDLISGSTSFRVSGSAVFRLQRRAIVR
jgi:hypothetical protein